MIWPVCQESIDAGMAMLNRMALSSDGPFSADQAVIFDAILARVEWLKSELSARESSRQTRAARHTRKGKKQPKRPQRPERIKFSVVRQHLDLPPVIPVCNFIDKPETDGATHVLSQEADNRTRAIMRYAPWAIRERASRSRRYEGCF